MDQAEANGLQVRVELQADCLAGVWANRAQAKWQFIEPGDVEAAMQTASAIGDDRLQRQAQGYVVPDSFTHGTSAQRTQWFMTGLKQAMWRAATRFSLRSVDIQRIRILSADGSPVAGYGTRSSSSVRARRDQRMCTLTQSKDSKLRMWPDIDVDDGRVCFWE